MPLRIYNVVLTSLLSGSLALSSTLPCVGFAQEKPPEKPVESEATALAKKLFVDGQKEFKKSNYKKAIELWEKAYEAEQRPLLLYNISLAYERLGDKEMAVAYAQRYIDAQPQDDPLVGQVKGNIEGLSKAIERPLSITAEPADAEITIDDGMPVASPIEVNLALGEHKIKVSKDGFLTQEQTVTIWLDPLFPVKFKLTELRYDVHIKGLPAGAQVKLNGEVIPDPRTLTSPLGKQTLEINAVGFKPFRTEFTVTGKKDVVDAALESTESDTKLLYPAILAGGALGTVGLGTIFALRSQNTFFTLEQNPELRTEENLALGKRQALAADLSFGGAALCIAGAATLLVLGKTSESSAQIAVQPDGAMVFWQGPLPTSSAK
jgi:hypothetical protein